MCGAGASGQCGAGASGRQPFRKAESSTCARMICGTRQWLCRWTQGRIQRKWRRRPGTRR
jgi:hypothetical protein